MLDVGTAEIRQPRDHHTSVGDRFFKRCEMNAWLTHLAQSV
jgi:hypothetical protein